MTTSTPPRRSARVASLARFRYRDENDSEDDKADVKHENPSDSDSPLSELSINSDIEDAIAPRKRTRAKPKPTTGKRKRAATTTTTTTTNTSTMNLPSRKKTSTAATKDEPQDEDADLTSIATDIKTKTPSRSRSRKPARVVTSKIKTEDGAEQEVETVEPPSDWEEIYGLVKAMRLGDGPAAKAAVDTMGCERLADEEATVEDRRFQTLVALMLSSQTKDTVNAVAMQRLKTELPAASPDHRPGLTLANMLAVDPPTLNRLIGQVGFHNNKTKYLKQAAELLRDRWNGDIPPTAEGLMSLPGVGPKMAYLCLAAEHGWNRVEGIGVDVHVHRITNLWGWQGRPGTARFEGQTPESTRRALQRWLPRDRWKEINWLLVGFGQTVCTPQAPKCGVCTVGLRGLCPKADRKKIAEGRRRLEASEQG